MKLLSPFSSFVLATAVLILGMTALSAQDQSAAAPATNGSSSATAALTPEEQVKWRTIKAKVLATNPDLKAESDDLNKQAQDLEDQGANASPEAKKALADKKQAHRAKLRAAALQIDPTMSVIFDKMDAWRKAHPKPAGT